jgi:MFS family permease
LPLFGQHNLMIAGGFCMALGVLAISWHPAWQVQIGIFLLFGLSFYLLHGAIQIFVTELVPTARGTATAFHSTFFFLGQSVGPIYYRTAFAELGDTTPFFIGAAILVLTGIVCSRGLHRPR